MSRQRLHGGLITLCFLLSCRLGFAIDPNASTAPAANPALPASSDLAIPAEPATPSMLALPAETGSAPGIDASTVRKFYTITASLRETYDDNIGTTNTDTQTSYETTLSPSILVSFPSNEGTFTARYTFNIVYYASGAQDANSGGAARNSIELSHEFIAQYNHNFSERFNLSVSELFRYFTEPSLDQSTGTAFRNGAYISNSLNGALSAQWTPLFGTSTTYANTVIDYEEADIAAAQNSVENTGSHSFSFSILPKISLSFGGIADNITYEDNLRGYTSYTAFVGAQWEVLPSLSFSARGGGSYTETVASQASLAPYAALSLNWILGERSSLSFSYSHEITPSDQIGAQGQSSDRFNASFNYRITPRLSTHLLGAFTNSTVPTALTTSRATAVSSQEYVYDVDTGLTYHYNKYFDFDTGVTLSSNSSQMSDRTYVRNEVYAGVRGTY
jgi:hypothetical protein